MSSALATPVKQIGAGLLDVGYVDVGRPDAPAVVLLHGWPYDIHTYADVSPLLAAAGHRVIVPYLRGYGTTRFLSADSFRNGQQAVLAVDTVALMDALGIEKAVVAGADWGARTADIVAALWPGQPRQEVEPRGHPGRADSRGCGTAGVVLHVVVGEEKSAVRAVEHDDVRSRSASTRSTSSASSRAPVVSICAIRGRARGAGSEFILACDLAFASRENTLLGQFEVGIGVVPGGAPMARLSRLAGRGRTLEILSSPMTSTDPAQRSTATSTA